MIPSNPFYRGADDSRPAGRLTSILLVGGAIGIASALSGTMLVYVGVALLLAGLVLRMPDVGALAVGAYWVAFAVKSVVFSTVAIEGLFFPFYFLFVAAILGALLRDGLRVLPLMFWTIAVFFGLVFVSLVGFTGPVDSAFIQKFVTMLICPLVLLSIQSRQGLDLVSILGGIAGVGISTWVIWEAALGGFAYRADVDVNQNIAAYVLGLSLVVVLAAYITPNPWRRWGLQTCLLAAFGTMSYALLLLASRGMTVALALATAAIILDVAMRDRRAISISFLLVVALGVGLMLPGGDGLLRRLESEAVSSAGDRTPIWEATVDAFLQGDVIDVAIGHGFNASHQVVREARPPHVSTHNAYLAMMFEYGVFGLLVFLAMHIVVLVRAARLRSYHGTLATGIIWLLLGANLTATTPDDFSYWLALGFAMALVSLGREV